MGPTIPERDEIRLVTFGETMLRFTPPPGERFETATELEFRTAGAESNVAVAASRLGTATAWLSKLTDNALGRRVVSDLQRHGVRPLIDWTDEGRQGTYYIEPGGNPRGTSVIYDREHAAVRSARPEDLSLDAVRGADAFMVSGITPALSTALAETVERTLSVACEADTTTVFDVNYRSKLWSAREARETVEELLELVDCLVVAERDSREVLGYEAPPADATAAMAADHGLDTVVVTLGADGALARRGERVVEQPAFDSETFDPIGSGDAFVGGLLSRLIEDADLSDALEYGAATAALKRTLNGDLAVVTPSEVERVVESDTSSIER